VIDLRDGNVTASAVIRAFDLQPHPEGGHFRETWRDAPTDAGRGVGTAILFLLGAGNRSHWHRVDAAELWVWQAGAALALSLSADGIESRTVPLGPDLTARQSLQQLVPAHEWQAASSLGAWTLVTCVVAPAFSFAGFELAPPGWQPG
jgi:predicted cupin superfamily sugar epimerase